MKVFFYVSTPTKTLYDNIGIEPRECFTFRLQFCYCLYNSLSNIIHTISIQEDAILTIHDHFIRSFIRCCNYEATEVHRL